MYVPYFQNYEEKNLVNVYCSALGFANNHSFLHVLIFSSSPSPSSRSYGFPSVLPSVCSSINSSSHQKVNYFFWLPLIEPSILPTECQETLIRHHTNVYEGRARSRVGKNLTLKEIDDMIRLDVKKDEIKFFKHIGATSPDSDACAIYDMVS